MKVLLDTNIVIHREAARVTKTEIGSLFRWLDKLGYEKCIHPITRQEIAKHQNPKVVEAFNAKINSYYMLKTIAPDLPEIAKIKSKIDVNENQRNDTTLLNELASGRVDALITEDRNIHWKAKKIGCPLAVFTIDSFLEKANSENPELEDYKVLSVRKEHLGNISLNDTFFDSFRTDYPSFDRWFNKKAEEIAYICQDDNNDTVAFLYVKTEEKSENYFDIDPPFTQKKRLKVGTLKVISNGFKIGERFIKIIFDNAIKFGVEEIYVTIFDDDMNKLRLIALLEDWGFQRHGIKQSAAGKELVLTRSCSPDYAAKQNKPRLTYPYAKSTAQKWIVPIYPSYHTELFPDSILNTESASDFIESTPNRNAISKVYISRSLKRDLSTGDIVVFYRTATKGNAAWFTSVTTTIGVVQSIERDIPDLEQFIKLCRRRSVYSDNELKQQWDFNRQNRPFVVNFVYLYSFPVRMNKKALTQAGVIAEAPRGFEPMTDEQFEKLLGGSHVDRCIIVD